MFSTLALSALAIAQAFVVEPYVHTTSNGGLFVAWVDDAPAAETAARVTFRVKDGRTVVADALREDGVWRAKVPLAIAHDVASYRIRGMTVDVDVHPVKAAAHRDRVRLGFVTDTQWDTEVAARAGRTLAVRDVDLVIHAGDVVNHGDDDEWRSVMDALSPATRKAPLFVAIGNHDLYGDSDGRNVRRFLGVDKDRAWSKLKIGDTLLIALDSTAAFKDDEKGQAQRAFLEEAIGDDARWKIVIFHHALFSEGVAHAEWSPWREHEGLRARFLDLIESGEVDLVLNGHTHLYERSRKDHVDYVVGGPAGGIMGLQGGENPHSLLSEQWRTVSVLDITEERIVVETERLDLAPGVTGVVDRLVIEKPVAPRFAGRGLTPQSAVSTRCQR